MTTSGTPATNQMTHNKRTRSKATFKKPCDHNNWDNVRLKNGITTLRCRVCQRQFKMLRTKFERCQAYLDGTCTAECTLLHVNATKQKLEERLDLHGAAGLAGSRGQATAADENAEPQPAKRKSSCGSLCSSKGKVEEKERESDESEVSPWESGSQDDGQSTCTGVSIGSRHSGPVRVVYIVGDDGAVEDVDVFEGKASEEADEEEATHSHQIQDEFPRCQTSACIMVEDIMAEEHGCEVGLTARCLTAVLQ